MAWEELDRLIDELDDMVGSRTAAIPMAPSESFSTPTAFLGFERHDWRPVWAKAKEIQNRFNAKVRYPTGRDRQRAWDRFNALRNRASEANNREREQFREMSEYFRDRIVEIANSCRYSPLTDILFFFDPTTIEDMKENGRTLRRAGRMLSEHKKQMLKEHKDDCFETINEVRASHDLFWGQYREARAARRQEIAERRSAAARKIEQNISNNRERLEKVRAAHSRNASHIDDLSEKLATARSAEWEGRFSDWLAEALERRAGLEEAEERIERWIREEEERLSDIYSKM